MKNVVKNKNGTQKQFLGVDFVVSEFISFVPLYVSIKSDEKKNHHRLPKLII